MFVLSFFPLFFLCPCWFLWFLFTSTKQASTYAKFPLCVKSVPGVWIVPCNRLASSLGCIHTFSQDRIRIHCQPDVDKVLTKFSEFTRKALVWSLNIQSVCWVCSIFMLWFYAGLWTAVKFPVGLWFVTHHTLLRLSVTHGIGFHPASWVHSPCQLYQSVGEMLTEPPNNLLAAWLRHCVSWERAEACARLFITPSVRHLTGSRRDILEYLCFVV